MKIAVYGSLRKGDYNFERFEQWYNNSEVTGFKYLTTTKIVGYKMYDLGWGYPCAVKTDDESEMVVDIIEVSEDCGKSITYMEVGAGYKPSFVEVDGHKCVIYLYKSPEGSLVKSGDWIKHKNIN